MMKVSFIKTVVFKGSGDVVEMRKMMPGQLVFWGFCSDIELHI